MFSLTICRNFVQVYKCQMVRSLCTTTLYRLSPMRSSLSIQGQSHYSYCVKHLKLDHPSSRVTHLPGLYSSEFRLKSDHQPYCSSTDNQPDKPEPQQQPGSDLPSPEQLQNIEEKLITFMELFLVSNINIQIFNGQTIVYINNLNGKNKTYKGVLRFTIQKLLLRLYVHFKFMSVNVNIIESKKNLEDGTITLHWVLSYIPNMMTVKALIMKERMEINGICKAKVKNDGLIHSLYLERKKVSQSKPDSDSSKNKNSLKEGVELKT